MIQRYSLLLIVLFSLSSCKQTREEMLSRKWQEISTENPQMDEVMKSQQQFIDTVGQHTTPEQNLQAYGFTNLDSFRTLMQANMDSFKLMQQREVEKTQFDFRKNGIVYLHSGNNVDSANWKFEEDGTLILDEQKLKGVGSQLHLEILVLNDTLLKIKFNENDASAIANFAPAKNKK